MKKFFLFCMMALVAMCGLNSCSDDCDHEFIEYDYNKALVGTWTCLHEGYAEAIVINADGSVVSTGVENGELWEGVKGSIKTVNNKMTLTFEDGDNFEGRFEMLSGEAFTIYEEDGESFTYRYCANDLSDEILGMWVCTQTPSGNPDDILVQTFYENDKSIYTGFYPYANGIILNNESKYKIFGDLNFIKAEGGYLVWKLIYTPKGTSFGDIMTFTNADNTTVSWLRIKQYLELPGMKYDYIKTFVTNVKGLDKDIEFMGTTFNFAKMDGSIIDKFLKSVLYNVQFPDAKTLQYNCLLEGQNVSLQLPMEVEGNKVTIKMSSRHASYRDVVVYAYQDVDGCQFHMYMPTASFENFFSNLSLSILSASGQVDINNPVHVEAVYKEVADALESINLSIVMSKTK